LEIEDILFRPPGRPSLKPLVRYKSFRYQAASWSKPRRVVAKVGPLAPQSPHPATGSSSVILDFDRRAHVQRACNGCTGSSPSSPADAFG